MADRVDMVVDKFSFISKLKLLLNATSDDVESIPGYMYPEINTISFESGAYCQELVDWLVDRLNKQSSHVKLKVLRIMKYVVINGHQHFKQNLRKKSRGIIEATKHSGPPDPLHGNAFHVAVRNEAQELSRTLFTITDDEDAAVSERLPVKESMRGIGSTGSSGMQGFGNTVTTNNRSVGDTILNSLQELAERVVDTVSPSSAMGCQHDVTFVVTNTQGNVGHFPGYKPVAVVTDVGDFSPLDGQKQCKPLSRIQPKIVHKPGVAGGGWNDDDDDDDNEIRKNCDKLSDSDEGVNIINSSHVDSVNSADSTAEVKLLNDVLHCSDSPIPSRPELNRFTESCSEVNCDKVVELLSESINESTVPVTMRALLVIEALLRTDLVTPDCIALTCHQQLQTLYMSETCDYNLQQKSRKIIRILEKLAPKQAKLFSDVRDVSVHLSEEANSHKKCDTELQSTAFPFLLTSSGCS